MGYYTRVFCKSEKNPTIKEILESVDINSRFKGVYTNLSDKEINSRNWKGFELFYNKDKLPILVEINRIAEPEGFAKEEIEEFKAFIGKPKLFETKKRKVVKHLNKTKFIVCNQLATSDIDEKGEDINGCVLWFFERNFEGIVQVDGEGIYIDEKYLIPIE